MQRVLNWGKHNFFLLLAACVVERKVLKSVVSVDEMKVVGEGKIFHHHVLEGNFCRRRDDDNDDEKSQFHKS